METTSFLHTGNIGDVWASLPAIRQYWRKTCRQPILYLEKDHEAFYYKGATHPTKNEAGAQVMLNDTIIKMMIPLLKQQPYIYDAMVWEGQPIVVDLNVFRETFVGMPNFSINRWYFTVYPDLTCDLSEPWISVPEAIKDLARNKILISRTERYRNDHADYSFIKPFEDDCLFIGTMREYNNFCMQFKLDIEKLHVVDFLEYAQAIQQSKFYLSNQSQGFQLAEGLKHPRIVELCNFAPNVIPVGKFAYDFLAQDALEWHFHSLNNTTDAFIEAHKKPAVEAGLDGRLQGMINQVK